MLLTFAVHLQPSDSRCARPKIPQFLVDRLVTVR